MKSFAKFTPVIALAAFGALAIASPALAQDAGDLTKLQLSVFEGPFMEALIGIINFVLLLGGILAFVFVLWGGFMYLSAGGDATGATKGKTMIVNAIIGLIIIFLSYSIVTFLTERFSDDASGTEFQRDDIN